MSFPQLCSILSKRSHRGQSLVEFIIVFPIFVLVLFGMLQVYQQQLYDQKISSTLWYVLRGSTYDFDHHTQSLTDITNNAVGMFAAGEISTSQAPTHGGQLDPQNPNLSPDTGSPDTSPTAGADPDSGTTTTGSNDKGTTVKITVDENAGALGTLAIMSGLNPLDVSLIRRVKIAVTVPNYFHGLPNPFSGTGFGSLLDIKDETLTYSQEGRIWASWTAIVNKPNVSKDEKAKYQHDADKNKYKNAKQQMQDQLNNIRAQQKKWQDRADYYSTSHTTSHTSCTWLCLAHHTTHHTIPPDPEKAAAAQKKADQYKKEGDALQNELGKL